jgi:hypothetical protein
MTGRCSAWIRVIPRLPLSLAYRSPRSPAACGGDRFFDGQHLHVARGPHSDPLDPSGPGQGGHQQAEGGIGWRQRHGRLRNGVNVNMRP